MTHGAAFLQAVLAEPDDDAPRLIFADWLEERGDPRGAFIRLQCALERLSPADPARPDLEDEADALLRLHEEEWTAPLQGIASQWRFHRGFVEQAAMAGDEFLAHGDDLFNAFPIIRLQIRMNRRQVAAVASSPHLARLWALDVSSCRLRDAGVEELLASPYLTRVNALDLARNDLEGPAFRMLIESPLMTRLTWLNLSFNGSLGVSAARRLAQSPAAAALQMLGLSHTNIGPGGLRDLLTSTFLASLTDLRAENINLFGALPVTDLISGPVLSRLSALDLGGFSGPAGLAELLRSPVLARLTTLRLSFCDLRLEGVQAIAESSHLSGLTTLDLSLNQIGAKGMLMLTASPQFCRVRSLHLPANAIRDAGARALAASPHMTRLTTLDLARNSIGGPGIRALAESANLARLRSLDLSGNYVGLESVRALAASPHLGRLTRLRLADNRLDDEAARLLTGSPHLPRLRQLDLSNAVP